MITIRDKSYTELKNMRLALSCSCGKDSVGLALLCLEQNIPLKYVIRYKNGDDWNCMDNVWEKLKSIYLKFGAIDTIFVELEGKNLLLEMEKPHSYYFNGKKYYGLCPCGIYSRYGTEDKISSLEKFSSSHSLIDVVGIAYGENRKLLDNKCYPLVEFSKTETDCLNLCRKFGISWLEKTDLGFSIDLYDFCSRLSCKHCSYSNSRQLSMIIAYFPSLYQSICDYQMKIDVPFKDWSSAFTLPIKLEKQIADLITLSKNFV